MVNGLRASDPRGLNKRRGSKFHVCSRVRQERAEGAWRTHQPKLCEYNNKDEHNSPKTLNDKRLNFDHIYKWYIRKPESVIQNDMHKIFWDFQI